MHRKKILIVGGYGSVGSAVSQMLAQDEDILLVIAGRDEAKARQLAVDLNGEARRIDITDPDSIAKALEDIALVINCFGGPFTGKPLHLAQACAGRGIAYLDVSGSYEYAERFLALNELARTNHATLITAQGANPGIPGIAVMSCLRAFDKLESARIIFVLGAKLDGISPASLQELKYMFDVRPLVWKKSAWIRPEIQSLKEYIGKPFEREVYLGASLTRDLLALPQMVELDELSFWSGSQFTGQGLLMILGLKMGLSSSIRGARLLLNGLKCMGRSPEALPHALIKIEAGGQKAGNHKHLSMEMYAEENYLTALAPVIACRQILEGKLGAHGAFVPPQVVPAQDFLQRLRQFPIHFSLVEME